MTINKTLSNEDVVVINPFDDDVNPFAEELPEEEAPEDVLHDPHGLVVDMTDHADLYGEVVRVELRECRSSLGRKVRGQVNKIAEDNKLIGLLEPRNLPEEGEIFRLKYYSRNGDLEYGSVTSGMPVRDVIKQDDYIYFDTDEGEWRLELIDIGN